MWSILDSNHILVISYCAYHSQLTDSAWVVIMHRPKKLSSCSFCTLDSEDSPLTLAALFLPSNAAVKQTAPDYICRLKGHHRKTWWTCQKYYKNLVCLIARGMDDSRMTMMVNRQPAKPGLLLMDTKMIYVCLSSSWVKVRCVHLCWVAGDPT